MKWTICSCSYYRFLCRTLHTRCLIQRNIINATWQVVTSGWSHYIYSPYLSADWKILSHLIDELSISAGIASIAYWIILALRQRHGCRLQIKEALEIKQIMKGLDNIEYGSKIDGKFNVLIRKFIFKHGSNRMLFVQY